LSSGDRGAPISGLFPRAEKKNPGIEERVGLSSAALRAGELVRGMRKANGWTQTQLADMLGWDQVRISNIERGEGTRGPTFDVLTKIAEACGFDLQFTPRKLPRPLRPKMIFSMNPESSSPPRSTRCLPPTSGK
jgi:DNA-binding XRE family transcriptional regulator